VQSCCVAHHEKVHLIAGMADRGGIKLLHRHSESTVENKGGCGGSLMKSSVVKHSIVIDGHKTSVSLEDAFWSSLKEIAHAQGATLGQTVAEIDKARQRANLSSAIRLFVLEYFRSQGTSAAVINDLIKGEDSPARNLTNKKSGAV